MIESILSHSACSSRLRSLPLILLDEERLGEVSDWFDIVGIEHDEATVRSLHSVAVGEWQSSGCARRRRGSVLSLEPKSTSEIIISEVLGEGRDARSSWERLFVVSSRVRPASMVFSLRGETAEWSQLAGVDDLPRSGVFLVEANELLTEATISSGSARGATPIASSRGENETGLSRVEHANVEVELVCGPSRRFVVDGS